VKGENGMALLSVRGLHTNFPTDAGVVRAVDGVDLEVQERQTIGLVGESGCGKSATALSIMGLIERPGRITAGTVDFEGRNLVDLDPAAMRSIRGKSIGMIFQEPMSSLNPVMRIGDQIAESVMLHEKLSRRESRRRAIEMLDLVRIPDAARRADDYPHALSGGMRQRVMIAIALACSPRLLIADEPTTALDVTVQWQILNLLRDLQNQLGMAILLITHDLGVVARSCDGVAVMYAGRIVEQGTWETLYRSPQHPYTEGLLKSIPQNSDVRASRLGVIPGDVPNPTEWDEGCRFAPRCPYRFDKCSQYPPLFVAGAQRSACWLNEDGARQSSHQQPTDITARTVRAPIHETEAALVDVRELKVHLPVRRGVLRRTVATVKAVDGVDLHVHEGETLGLVGESGSGKSTLARAILRLGNITGGSVTFEGEDITTMSQRLLRPRRPRMQMIFQDPAASLNPRTRVVDIIGEGLLAHHIVNRSQVRPRVQEILGRVGLRPEHADRYPNEFSGGQRQRIGIARALALSPRLIVADEPVSALDVSVQSQVLNLMADLRDEFGITYVFIAHNLAVVRHVSDRVAVMYLGRIVESAPTEQLYQTPRHPYTQALLSAIPDPDPSVARETEALEGDVPSPIDPPSGCSFRTRCRLARAKGTQNGLCADVTPPTRVFEGGHEAACHFAEEASLVDQ
jgi:peptide/nickel transport system ATP-binding protein